MNRAIRIFLLLIIIVFPLQSPFVAESASIAKVDIFNTGKRLVLDVSLKDGFSEDIVEAINSGVPVGISYTIVLKKRNPFFFDKKVVVRNIKRTVKFDTLKEKYTLVDIRGKRSVTKITDNFDEVARTMTALESIHLISNNRLNQEKKYYVMVKAELNSKRAWFPFNYILYFVPFLNFDTSWQNSSPFTFK